MEREFKIPNAAVAGRIKELAVSVEGGKRVSLISIAIFPKSSSGNR
jgi:hypothetical protein